MVVGEQHGCLLERHPAPPTCCGTPAGGFFVLPHRTASGSGPCPGGGCPRLPTCGWLLSRGTGEHRRQGPPGLVHPWPQEPPVPHGQCLVLGVHGCDQLLEQAADLSGPVPSAVVGCAAGLEVPSADEVHQGGAMTGPAARPFRRSGPAVAGCWWWCGVLFQRSGLGVPGRVPARSPDQYRGDQRGNQHDQQDPAKGPQASGLAGGRLGSSRRRGSGGCRQRCRRRRRLDRCRRPGGGRRPGGCWRLSGGPGRSRRRRGRLAR
jgi:hypothetical protein